MMGATAVAKRLLHDDAKSFGLVFLALAFAPG
jgi:hypothetical protein